MILEIRTYRVAPGRLADLVGRMREVLPLLADAGIDVVGLTGSLVEDEGEHAVLLRRFASVAERDRLEEAFYGGPAWRDGPREQVMELIESYHTVVLDLPADVIDALAEALAHD